MNGSLCSGTFGCQPYRNRTVEGCGMNQVVDRSLIDPGDFSLADVVRPLLGTIGWFWWLWLPALPAP